ncbi:MAG: ATP-binding cassette domain-containing protein [Candidatus Limnocylindrales bacterium]
MATNGGLALATHGLMKRYGRQVALAGLDISVPRGTVYGFLGPNGAGKTTTMRLLTGLLRPDAGSIELLGEPYVRSDRRRLFRIGSLSETPSFYPHLSARDNLLVTAATGKTVPSSRVDELLDLVGLRERAQDRVSGYSMGMKQRLGIAVALLNDPELLLLDEPANGLDPAGIVALRDTLRTLASNGKTVFISSHILPEVEQLADIVGIIALGRIVSEGPLNELLAGQAVVRVRVRPDEVDRAMTILTALAGPDRVTIDDPDAAWLKASMATDRAAEANRALGAAGIYASGLASGSDLESLFLELTATQPPEPQTPTGAIPGWRGGAA